MKGIILAAGEGKRLRPITKVIPKCLLPVYDKPMIYYPLEKLVEAGIKDVLIITKPKEEKLFRKVLNKFDKARISYTHQKKARGPVDALKIAEKYVKKEKIILIFGDNIFQDSLENAVKNFNSGAHVFLKKVYNPHEFGIAELSEERKILSIEEKPENPKTNYAVIGCYLYDEKVFDYARKLKREKNRELDITSLNNIYIKNHELSFNILQGFWADAGTFEGLRSSTILVKIYKK